MQKRKIIVGALAFGLMSTGAAVVAKTTVAHDPAATVAVAQPDATPRTTATTATTAATTPATDPSTTPTAAALATNTPPTATTPTTPTPTTPPPTTQQNPPAPATPQPHAAAKRQPRPKQPTTKRQRAPRKLVINTTARVIGTPGTGRLEAWDDAIVMTAGVHERGDVPVLANDPGAHNARVKIIKAPRVGTATVLPDGRIRYQRVGKGLTKDRLVYQVIDNRGRKATATLKIKMRRPAR